MVYERKPAPGGTGGGADDRPLTNQNKSMEGRPGQGHGADGIEGQRGRDWSNPESGGTPGPADAANERPSPGLAGYGDGGEGYTGHPIDQGYTDSHRPASAADDAGTIDGARGSTRPGSDRR